MKKTLHFIIISAMAIGSFTNSYASNDFNKQLAYYNTLITVAKLHPVSAPIVADIICHLGLIHECILEESNYKRAAQANDTTYMTASLEKMCLYNTKLKESSSKILCSLHAQP